MMETKNAENVGSEIKNLFFFMNIILISNTVKKVTEFEIKV